MIKVTNLLKLSNDASEDAIVESIGAIENEKNALKNKAETLEKSLQKLKLNSSLLKMQKLKRK